MFAHINSLHSFKNLYRILLLYHHLFNDSSTAQCLCSLQIFFFIINKSAGNILTTVAVATATMNLE